MPEKTQIPSDISAKNTKNQILEAYEQVVKQLQNQSEKNPQQQQKSVEQRDTLSRATKNSEHAIISNLAELKINLTKQLDHLSEQLVGEFSRLSDLQKSISVEQEHLQNLYGIKDTAHTLSALIITQEEESKKHQLKIQESQAAFENDMAEKRQHWHKERQTLEQEYKEFKSELDRKRSRDEEEYSYSLKMSRRKDEDEYKAKQNALEKEMTEKKRVLGQREADLKQSESELAQFKKTVDAIPAEIAKAVEETEKRVTSELQTRFKFDTELRAKEIEGERKLMQQKTVSLEAKIKEQQALINTLLVKTDEATDQIKAIACQALDVSGDRFNRPAYGKSTEGKPEDHRIAA
ncbi:MAG: hypothetical protein ABFQ95_00020 [Pseudomonadota bacterium]